MNFLLQKNYGGYESVLVRERSVVDRVPVISKSIDEIALSDLIDSLPVGSVEFLSRCMSLLNINATLAQTYPKELKNYLDRPVLRLKFKDRMPGFFIKPTEIKKFTGGRVETIQEKVDEDEWCWQSPLVEFQSEYRYYIQEGKIMGMGRYDDGPEPAPVPCAAVVAEMASAYWIGSGIKAVAIDVGVLKNGKTVLVEVNDAWATGFYKGTLSSRQYIDWLTARWLQLKNTSDFIELPKYSGKCSHVFK